MAVSVDKFVGILWLTWGLIIDSKLIVIFFKKRLRAGNRSL